MSTTDNPHFCNVERANYELSHLLLNIGKGESADTVKQMARAAETHAAEAHRIVVRGLEAMGHLIWVAGGNEQNEIDPGRLRGLGELVSHLARELQLLSEVEDVTYCAEVAAGVDSKSSKGKSGVAKYSGPRI
jgi:hypothetical protein